MFAKGLLSWATLACWLLTLGSVAGLVIPALAPLMLVLVTGVCGGLGVAMLWRLAGRIDALEAELRESRSRRNAA